MRVDLYNYSSVELDNLPINSDWDGRDVSENLMHRIHAYPAKFPAFITTKAIQYAESKAVQVDTVADTIRRLSMMNFWRSMVFLPM